MIMYIPKRFQCAGYTWKVRIIPGLRKRKKVDGSTHWRSKEIRIEASLPGDQMMHTYLHEVTHVVLHAVGLDKFNEDEHDNHLDAFAGLLYQVFATAKLEHEEDV